MFPGLCFSLDHLQYAFFSVKAEDYIAGTQVHYDYMHAKVKIIQERTSQC